MPQETTLELRLDRALAPKDALYRDKLGRRAFATVAVEALGLVGESAGFVLSIEGAWGSGKTSTLAMIEALLRQRASPPVIIHFNPWQIGDKDALLRVFFAKIATELEMADGVGAAQKAAQQLKAYAKVFDVIKLIPGAGELAQAARDAIGNAGDALEAAANQRSNDLEGRKCGVETALREMDRPVIVFIDDIDRLFPQEVFEMVRIIKAIGDLPNVGYVLAWDQEYVADALRAANVPRADGYLDKIIQVRLPLPMITKQARTALIDGAIARLPIEAREVHFPKGEERLSKIYFAGLRDLLEQPRDFERVFNTVALIEPPLRGEIVLADIIGLAALMVKGGAVYEMLKREPKAFVGRVPTEDLYVKKDIELVKDAAIRRKDAISSCSRPVAVTRLVHALFPMTAEADGADRYGKVSDVEGHIAAASRLIVALQLHVSDTDVSVVLAKRYMLQPAQRSKIVATLGQENCLEFLETIGDIAPSTPVPVEEAVQLCVAIANLLEQDPFLARARGTHRFFSLSASTVAVRAIENIVQRSCPERAGEVAKRLIEDPRALTVAVDVCLSSFEYERSNGDRVLAAKTEKEQLTETLATNIVSAASSGSVYSLSNPGRVLWSLSLFREAAAQKALEATRQCDPTLDQFVMTILGHTFDSTNGLRYEMPEHANRIDAYLPIADLEAKARERLADPAISLPASAAWRAVVDKEAYYAVDGSRADSRRG